MSAWHSDCLKGHELTDPVLKQRAIPERRLHHTPSAQLFLFDKCGVGGKEINVDKFKACCAQNVFFQDYFQKATERRSCKFGVCIINGANDWDWPAVEMPSPIWGHGWRDKPQELIVLLGWVCMFQQDGFAWVCVPVHGCIHARRNGSLRKAKDQVRKWTFVESECQALVFIL